MNRKTYSSNIGHRNWPGCFRCHDGRHVAKSGKVLSMAYTSTAGLLGVNLWMAKRADRWGKIHHKG